ncbi:ATP-binding cassette domain-containing protein [Vibrio intestinalis]|uniref:ATP-binding cassette domain-containing protein n=1 Tax=Vibrio intestinalis TaxID=2933291 RepID=UPI0021A3BB7B|nr:ATP-binding cassette domain-containing protein [Vibrio intestinalis]
MVDKTFISVQGVAKRYQPQGLLTKQATKQVLTDINLEIKQGESVALVGASGSGKSTLCRLILGLEPTSDGSIFYQGKPISNFTKQDWIDYRQEVQLVFQDAIGAVNPRQTIGQILAEPLRYLRKLSKQEIESESQQLMAKVGLDADLLARKAGQLSGGQLQRVGIARALAVKPKLIALDESLSSLDLVLQQQMIALLKSIQQESGTAFLLITHDLRLVDLFCHRVIVLDQGEIVESRPANTNAPWQSEMGKKLNAAILPAMPVVKAKEPESTVERPQIKERPLNAGTAKQNTKPQCDYA